MCAFAFSAASAGAVEVKLTVADTTGVARKGEPVTTGVPFAKGAVKDVSKLTASVAGTLIPAQFIKTVPWPDGSVRWALLDTQVDVPAGGKTELVVSSAPVLIIRGGRPAPRPRLKDAVHITHGTDGLAVSTGPMQFTIDKKGAKFNPFASVRVDGKEVVHGYVFTRERIPCRPVDSASISNP